MRHLRKQLAFTIVELIVVISIIAILALIVTLSFGAWRSSVTKSQIKSDLSAAASHAQKFANSSGDTGYNDSTNLLSGFSASSGVVISVDTTTLTKTYFCLNGRDSGSTVYYYIESPTRDKGAVEGTCADAPDRSVPTAATIASLTTTSVSALNLTWSAVAGADSYTSQCSTDQAFIGNLTQATTTAPTVSRAVTGLTANATYYCRVRAVNTKGAGDWSTIASASTSSITPTGLIAQGDASTTAKIKWNSVPSAIKYTVQQCAESACNGSSGIPVKSYINITNTNLTATDLVGDLTYYFRVSSTNSGGTSGYSSTKSVNRVTNTVGLLAWWKLNNGNANNEVAGVSIDGTLVGGVTSSTGQSGLSNTALTLNGTTGYINFGEKYNSQALPISISMWVKRDPGKNMWFTWDDTSSTYYGPVFYAGDDGAIQAMYGDGTGTGSSNRRSFGTGNYATPVTDSVWHHIVITISGAVTATMYMDGVSYQYATSGTGGALAHTTSGPMRMGILTRSGPSYSGGAFDDVRLYNRVLSSSEVQALYDGGAW